MIYNEQGERVAGAWFDENEKERTETCFDIIETGEREFILVGTVMIVEYNKKDSYDSYVRVGSFITKVKVNN
ncbi:hypothetical protein Theth_1647 [Pseudothermotoga thermarum DSM 5069]|uniref:Uncharacterized protein n=1 Tax=Pseudothermotoga thermarum DSM 5069 TaxID=688269 RepID=F7YVN0_9THEM|nr:hypothetical protein Theth_1647 [Pseudothermotoga thermarum DSM 5069]